MCAGVRIEQRQGIDGVGLSGLADACSMWDVYVSRK